MRIQVKVADLPMKTFKIPLDEIKVGRGEGNHLQINSDSISRFHLKVRYGKEGYLVEDSGSKNGTFHEGQRLQAHQSLSLDPNSKLILGGQVEMVLLEDLSFAEKPVGERTLIGMSSTLGNEIEQRERTGEGGDKQGEIILGHEDMFGLKKYKELQNLFNKTLRSRLTNMEELRTKVKVLFILSGLGFASSFFVLKVISEEGAFFYFLLPACSLIAGVVAYVMKRKYRKLFKEDVVREIFKFINTGWSYEPDGHISESLFKESGIFQHGHNSFTGDDLVRGKIGQVNFQMSELEAVDKAESKDDSTVVVFKGLFLYLDFNKRIKGETYVLKDIAESVFGNILGKALQSITAKISRAKGELVNLENPDFEKEFVVYSTDQVEARYILTPKMMETILMLRKDLKRTISFSFKNCGVYMAINYSEDLFEPRVLSTGVSFGDMKFIFFLFSVASLLVEEMELNTRIWSLN